MARSPADPFREALSRAAVIGDFDPIDLLGGLDPATKRSVLLQLGHLCDEVVVDGEPLWRLRAEERRRVLATLRDARAARRLIGKAPPRPGDTFGQALQEALIGSGRAASAPEGDPSESYAARTCARAAPFAAARASADPRPLRRDIEAEQARRRRQVVLPGKLHGRSEESGAIEGFLRDGSADGRAMLVTGVGGIGKSALIASVVARATEDREDPLTVVVLDFDRPTLFRADRIEVAREITRQIGRQHPRLDRALSEARARFGFEQAAFDPSLRAAQQGRVLSHLAAALTGPPRLGRIAVVLDTFEEVAARGEGEVGDLLDWLDALRTSGGLRHMRLLISGRSAPDPSGPSMARRVLSELRLPGLPPDAGAALLREDEAGRALFDDARARRASEVLRGHPQALRLLRRYAAEHPEDIDAILEVGLEDGGFGIAFAQAFLYARILERIRDAEVRALAHPGLVLRRVSPDLIREVLAGPCGFGAIDPPRARDLFERLAATAWIVDPTERDDVVRHSPELRRLMLPGMMRPQTGDDRQQELRRMALDIHAAAARWYGEGRDAALAPELQAVEAFYHRAFSAPEAVSMDEVASFAGALGEDAANLPPRVRGMAKIALGRVESVTEAEAAFLTPDLRESVVRRAETSALKRGDTAAVGSAAPPPAAPEPPQVTSFAEAEERFGRAILARWAEGRYEEVVRIADGAYNPLWRKGAGDSLLQAPDDPVFLAVWTSLLARSLLGRWPPSLASRDAWDRFRGLYDETGIAIEGPQGLVRPALLHLAALVLAADGEDGAQTRRRLAAFLGRRPAAVVPEATFHTAFELRLFRLLAPLTGQDHASSPSLVLARQLRLLTPPRARTILTLARGLREGTLSAVADLWTGTMPPGRTGFDSLSAHVLTSPQASSRMAQVREDMPLPILDDLLEELGGWPLGLDFDEEEDRHEGRLFELHAPILSLLRPIAEHPGGFADLARVGEAAAIWPPELRPGHLGEVDPSAVPSWLAQLVVVADHCGLLGDLLSRAMMLRPSDELAATARLLERMEMLFNGPAHSPI